MNRIMEKFFKFLFSKEKNQDTVIYTILGFKIRKTKYIKMTHDEFEKRLDSFSKAQTQKLVKIMPREFFDDIVVHLTEHCNLNCQMCDNFSPIAKEEFADLETLKKDFLRFKELVGNNVNNIILTGGEAALHPQLLDVLVMTRTIFTYVNIVLQSNGILLPGMDSSFWQTCKDNNIKLQITEYPIKINKEKIESLAKEYNVQCDFWGSWDEDGKTSYHIPLDLEGKQDSRTNFVNCFHANQCIYLQNGRIYTCSTAACIRHFNKFFDKNLPDIPENSISIYEAGSMKEILEFLAKPIPLCKYCYVSKREFGIPWAVSKKDISEWTVCEK